MAYPLRSRFRTGTTLAMFTLVVFTLVTGTHVDRLVPAAPERRRHVRRRVRRPRGHRRDVPPIADMQRRARRSASASGRPTTPWSAASPSSRSTRASWGRAGRSRTTSCAASTARSSRTRRSASAPSRAATRARATSGRRSQEHVGLAVVDSLVVPRRDNFGFDVMPSDFRLTRVLRRGRQAFDPVPVEVLDQQTGREDAADGDRRPHRHRAPRDERHLDLAGDAQRRRSRGAPSRRSTTSPRSRRRPGRSRAAARVGVPRQRPRGGVDPEGRRRRRRREQDVQPADPGLHGPRARRRRRRARRDQRPGRGRAAPADRGACARSASGER